MIMKSMVEKKQRSCSKNGFLCQSLMGTGRIKSTDRQIFRTYVNVVHSLNNIFLDEEYKQKIK